MLVNQEVLTRLPVLNLLYQHYAMEQAAHGLRVTVRAFIVCLLKGTDTPDDFCHLQEITDTNELHLEFLLPAPCQQVALAEAICHQLPRDRMGY